MSSKKNSPKSDKHVACGPKKTLAIWTSSFWEITFLVRKKSVIWDFFNKKFDFSKMDSPNMCQDNVFPAMHSCTYCENLPFFCGPYFILNFWVFSLKHLLLKNCSSEFLDVFGAQKQHPFTSPVQFWAYKIQPCVRNWISK